jgi:DNA-binding MarR family transcriptional regulator
MPDELRDLADVNRLIHEPARLLIVTLLFAVERADFLYLLHETGLTKGNLSAHLSKLEEVGYIRIEKTYRGKVPLTLLSLTPDGRIAFESYRDRLQKLVQRISQT